jgi:hypothetical protein
MDISVGYGYEKRSKTIGGPPEGGERSRSSAGRRLQSHETWKTELIPDESASKTSDTSPRIAPELPREPAHIRTIPRNPDALKRILEPEGEQHEV